ncbi:MAG: hypothetical protein J7513_14140, partial [Solirubrobacteraceae bacterium]|nr:hypothetical protein [Solirubrobacteraceae bacterium]
MSLVSALVLGAAIVRRIPFPLYRFEAVAMTVVLGLFSWTWISFLLALVLPYDVGVPLTLVIGAVAALMLWPGGGGVEARELEGGRRSWIVWAVATAATIPLLGRLFYTHSLTSDSQGIWSAGASWADYGVHSAIISHIAAASSLPSDLPVASGEKITYPFLIDFLSAMYVQGGASLHQSLFWPGVLLALAICQLMISFGLRLFGRISVGVGALGFALTIGSAAGLWAAWGDWRDSGKGFFSFLGELPGDYSQVPDSNANVTNFLVDALLPQRSILFGFGVGLIILTLLHVSRDRDEKKLLWPAAVLVGLMPMAHPHTFMVTFGVFAFLAVEAAWQTRKPPLDYLKPLGLAFVLAIPQLAWQQLANDHGTGGRFRFGWMVQEGHSVFG